MVHQVDHAEQRGATLMLSAIISALAAAFKLASEWMRASRDKLLLTLGGKQQEAASLRQRLKDIQIANAAREKARADMNRDKTHGRAPDEFMRPDDETDA